MSIILDTIKAFFNCQQKDNKLLQDYTRRFKLSREIMNSHLGGGIVLRNFVESMDKYDKTDPDKTKELIKTVDEQLASYVYLVNLDEDK